MRFTLKQLIPMLTTLSMPKREVKHVLIILLSCILFCNGAGGLFTYCSSRCASIQGVCAGPSENDCTVCSTMIYNGSGTCQISFPNQIYMIQLKNSGVDLSGYSSSKPVSHMCNLYSMSGQYVAGDYISKTFALPANHYVVMVRFSIVFVGTWDAADEIVLTMEGQNYTYLYNTCPSQNLCSAAGTDCVKIFQKNMTHDKTSLSLKFTSTISEMNSSVKYWGVKDLVIAGKKCDSKCETCFGPNPYDCVTCSQGFYLLGNVCVEKCRYYALESRRTIVQECPMESFDNGNGKCESCQDNCLVCPSAHVCKVWNDKKQGLVWEENKMFWILVIILSSLAVGFLIWKFLLSKVILGSNLLSGRGNQAKKNLASEGNNLNDQSEIQNQSSMHIEPKINVRNSTGMKRQINQTQAVFQQEGLQWVAQIPTVDQLLVPNQQHVEKRRKKKAKSARQLSPEIEDEVKNVQ